MARQLLAGLEQEPVGYYRLAEDGVSYYLSSPDQQRDGTIPLYAAPQLPQPAVKVMSKDESRELFERHCYVNKERNKYHPEYYAHYPARQQWEIWEACREVMTNSEEIFKDMRKEFERWMVEEKKCIVGSSDPYPRGMEEDSWLAWKAAWNACRAAMLQGAEPVSQPKEE